MALLEFLGDILNYMTGGNRAKSRFWRWVNRIVFWTIAAFAAYLLYVMYMRGNEALNTSSATTQSPSVIFVLMPAPHESDNTQLGNPASTKSGNPSTPPRLALEVIGESFMNKSKIMY